MPRLIHRLALRVAPLVLALSAGCVRRYVIQPVGGASFGRAVADGVELYADPLAWEGDPYDLPEYLTPIALRIVNNSGADVAVSYGAFELVDQSGFRYAMLHPFASASGRSAPAGESAEPAGAGESDAYAPSPGEPPAEQPTPPADEADTQPAEPKPAGEGSDHTDDGASLPSDRAAFALVGFAPAADSPRDDAAGLAAGVGTAQPLLARRVVRRRSAGRSVRVYRSGPRRGRGFYVYPRGRHYRTYRHYRGYPRGRTWVRGYWGHPYPFWPVYTGPVYPYYPYPHTYVHVWAGPSYPRVTDDVRRVALPEGVIKAGGEVSGFVYFQNALARSDRLELTWHARTADGKKLATLKIPFVVAPM